MSSIPRAALPFLLAMTACGGSKKEASAPEPPACTPGTLYLVRHAEKAPADEYDGDPPLSAEGARRAKALVTAMDGRPLGAIYATHLIRTQQTVGPLAGARGLEVRVLDADATEELAARLLTHHCGEAALAAGHSNTLPELSRRLYAAPPIHLADDDYGDLFILTPTEGGGFAVETESF